jgi:hypothetical protein
MREDVLVDSPTLIEQTIQALGIFNHPAAVSLLYFRVQARDAHAWNMDIVSRQPPNGELRLIQLALTDDLAIDFDQNARGRWWGREN